LICDDFITFGSPGPTFFAPQAGMRLRKGPGLDFFAFLLAPLVRKRDAKGVQRVAGVTPNAPKSPPGDLQKSMEIDSVASGGCPCSPERSQGAPLGSKSALKITFCATSRICHEANNSTCSLSSVQRERARTSDIFPCCRLLGRSPTLAGR